MNPFAVFHILNQIILKSPTLRQILLTALQSLHYYLWMSEIALEATN